ncbi:MAG: hypothetical protein CMC60_01705, partial [Flavobacteriaceae bacterium]|nr:hypothetical protein [Flavobacteriaceae bacterium]
MRRLLIIFVCLLFGCEDDPVKQNPYLNNLPTFEFELNLDLPLYDNLRFSGGTLSLSQLGLKGVHLYNLDGSQILAWESSCPNQRPSDCSDTIVNGIEAVCNCDDSIYSLVTGQPLSEGVEYGLI